MKMGIIFSLSVFLVLGFQACSVPEHKADAEVKRVVLSDELCIEIWHRARTAGTKERIIHLKMDQSIEDRESAAWNILEAEEKVFKKYGVSREEIDKCFSTVSETGEARKLIEKASEKIRREELERLDLEMADENRDSKEAGNLKITSIPPERVKIGDLFEYQVEAAYTTGEKPEEGQIHFRLLGHPFWMFMKKGTGKILWMPCCSHADLIGCRTGKKKVAVQAFDSRGNIDTQEFTIEVLPSVPKIRFSDLSEDKKITIKVGETILIRQYAQYVTSTLDPVTFDLSYKVSPDDGGVHLESSVVKTWDEKGCTSFFPVYSATGKKAGRYEVITTLTVRENGCTGSMNVVIEVE